MSRIYKRAGTKLWQCSYIVPGNPKPVRESTGTEDELKAKQFLEGRIRETGYKRVVGPAAERAKFADLEKLIVDDYKVKGRRSLRSLKGHLAHLRASFGNYRAYQITSSAIAAYAVDRVAQQAAAGSVNRELACLRRMFKLAHKHELVESAPYIELLPEDNARMEYFTHAEFIAVREKMPDALRGFISALYHTGVRRTQMAMLEWRDINYEAGVAVFRGETTKNNQPHTIPLSEEFGQAIEEARARRRLDCRFVFHLNGQGLCYKDGSLNAEVREVWATALKAAGLEGRIMHDFRRSAAHHLAKAGVPEQVAMMVTGHLSSSMYRRYNIIDQQSVAEAMKAQRRYLESLPQAPMNKVTKL